MSKKKPAAPAARERKGAKRERNGSSRERSAPSPLVKCAHAELVPTGKLSPNKKNPNKHPDAQLDLYGKILLHQGWRKAVVVSRQSGMIVTGHGAWLTAKRQGWPTVPVDYQDFATPEDETAHLLADNRLPQLAETDSELLVELLETDLGGKVELAGFTLGDEDIPPAALPKPPPSVEENIKHLESIKAQRREGNEEIIAKTDTEYYLVIAFASRADKEAALRRLGLPEDERYLSPGSVLLLPANKNPKGGKRPKASPPNKAGACGRRNPTGWSSPTASATCKSSTSAPTP
jgi:ParB-like chromosome segregation protein Spo0J